MRKLALAVAAYVVVLGALALWRWHVWTYGTDTGTFAQVVTDALGGFRDAPEQGTHFRFHWAPIVAVLGPLVAAARTPLVLQLAQVVLVALSAVPLYRIARAYVEERRAWGYAALVLLYPPLAAVAFTEFHEIAFYPVLALALFWAADRARWRWFAAFAVLSALVREEACIVLAIVGLVFAGVGLARRGGGGDERPRGLLAGSPKEPGRLALAGIGLALVNVAALGVYYGAVIPRVGAWQPSRFYDYDFATGPAAVVVALIAHPQHLRELLTFGRFTYLLEAVAPLALLPLFSRWSLLAVPGLLAVLLSSDPIAWRMGSHYAALWAPWLVLGAVAALMRRPVATRRWFPAAVAVCAVFLVAINPMHVAHYVRPVYPTTDVERALALVPAEANLATHDEWFAHDALRHRRATVFFCPYVDWAVYADDYPNGYYQGDIRPAIAHELRDGRMRAVASFGRVRVYRRTPDAGARVGDCVTPGNIAYRGLPATLGAGD